MLKGVSGTLFLSILIFFTVVGVSRAGEGYTGRVLTGDEMGFPPGRYQCGVDINHQCRVRLDSPTEEPVISEIINTGKHTDEVLVDGEGGMWYAVGSGENYPDTLIRLNPDGDEEFSMEFEQSPYENLEYLETLVWDFPDLELTPCVIPVVALDQAMVVYVGWDVLHDSNNTNLGAHYDGLGAHAYLECIDTVGQTRWRTHVTGYNKLKRNAWRVDDDQIAMVSSEYSFDVFEISTGEFVESVHVPGWSSKTRTGPLKLDYGDWLIHCDDFESLVWGGIPLIYRQRMNGSKAWEIEYRSHTYSNAVTLSERGIISYGNKEGARGIDLGTGEELWEWRGGESNACGITMNGNFLVAENYMNNTVLESWDQDGVRAWNVEVDYPIEGEDDVIIYRDGNILFGHGQGLSLLSEDGEEIWTIENNEIGGRAGIRSGGWRLNPLPDGGLAAIGNDPSGQVFSKSIYILRQP